jgi:mono/diheme cytochrome c family protein
MRAEREFSLRQSVDLAVFSIVAMLGCMASACADSAQDVRKGNELAVRFCSPCHLVSSQAGQDHARAPSGASFEQIAKGSKAGPEALRILLLSTQSNVSHPGGMPNPKLTEDQIRLISAYISSLRDAK